MKALILTAIVLISVITAGTMAKIDADQAGSVKLNPEASKAYASIVAAEVDLQKQYANLEQSKVALLIGANVPAEARGNCTVDAPDSVSCSKPKPSPSPAK